MLFEAGTYLNTHYNGGFFKMIEIKEQQVEALINEAIQKLEKSDDVQLVSITQKIDKANPLHFFDGAKYMEKDRTFWSSTTEDFYIVGIGNAYEIIATKSRFQ